MAVSPFTWVSLAESVKPGNVDILAADIVPNQDGAFRITVACDEAVDFNLMVDGVSVPLLLGTLTANKIAVFTVGVRRAYSYNFQHEGSTGATIRYLTVEEIDSAVI
jgi:hypothetical protein